GIRRDIQGVALDIHLADAPRAGIIHELRVGHRIRGGNASVELLEHSEQDQRNHHPDRDLGKRVVQDQPPGYVSQPYRALRQSSWHVNTFYLNTEESVAAAAHAGCLGRHACPQRPFSPRLTMKVSEDLSRDALGLRSATRTKCCLNNFTIWENPLP